jgi:hypothetical protein
MEQTVEVLGFVSPIIQLGNSFGGQFQVGWQARQGSMNNNNSDYFLVLVFGRKKQDPILVRIRSIKVDVTRTVDRPF